MRPISCPPFPFAGTTISVADAHAGPPRPLPRLWDACGIPGCGSQKPRSERLDRWPFPLGIRKAAPSHRHWASRPPATRAEGDAKFMLCKRHGRVPTGVLATWRVVRAHRVNKCPLRGVPYRNEDSVAENEAVRGPGQPGSAASQPPRDSRMTSRSSCAQ